MDVLHPLRFDRNGVRVNTPPYCKCSFFAVVLLWTRFREYGQFTRDDAGNVVYLHCSSQLESKWAYRDLEYASLKDRYHALFFTLCKLNFALISVSLVHFISHCVCQKSYPKPLHSVTHSFAYTVIGLVFVEYAWYSTFFCLTLEEFVNRKYS